MLRLRHSLLLIAFASSTLSAQVRQDEVEARAEAVTAIEAAGGSVLPMAQGLDQWVVNFSIHGHEATDEVLVHLNAVGPIIELSLARTKITDAGLGQLASLTNLRRLDLHRTAIADAGLKQLAPLKSLEYLNLYGTQVSDAGLEHLVGMASLRRLYVWNSKVTPKGAAALEERLPELAVDGGWESLIPVDAERQTCCTVAEEKGEACGHACCMAAAEKGRTCFACNPTLAETCCEKGEAVGVACEHPCCVEARAKDELCAKCNPEKPEPDPDPDPEPEKKSVLKAGGCCDLAQKADKACSHPCCVAAAEKNEICAACNS